MSSKKCYEKYKHLIGSKYDKWTILDIIVREDQHHTSALSRCECGTVKEVRLSYILNKKVKDCGCGHKSRLAEAIKNKYKHLIGTEVNKWTIIDIIPPSQSSNRTYALCKCRCGTIKNVQMSYIINEKSKDCGCGRKETLKVSLTKDLVGQTFGKLRVVEMLEQRNKHGRIMYRCKCDCGNETIVLGNSLKMGHTLSCGCLLSQHNMIIRKLLTDRGISFKPEYTVNVNDTLYRFDFYLPTYNLCIEYDGEQHYIPANFGSNKITPNENLELIRERDKAKNEYCASNCINLLRIPYWENNNIETIIDSHLQRLSEKGFVA